MSIKTGPLHPNVGIDLRGFILGAERSEEDLAEAVRCCVTQPELAYHPHSA